MYYTKQNGELIPCNNLESYGYFQAGFQDEKDKGKLSTLLFIPGAGTCLVPVFTKEGEEIVKPEFAGLYYKDTI